MDWNLRKDLSLVENEHGVLLVRKASMPELESSLAMRDTR
jgi:hypothetical protein